MDREELGDFQCEVALALHRYSLKNMASKIVSRDTGEEITERLGDWFVGVVGIAFQEVIKMSP